MVLDTAKSASSDNTITCGISSGRLLGKRILVLMQPRFLQASGLGWQDAIVLILLAALIALPGGRRTSLESSRSLCSTTCGMHCSIATRSTLRSTESSGFKASLSTTDVTMKQEQYVT